MEITRPTLLLDGQKCKRNIRNMIKRSEERGVKLVPHFKTHQSAEVGEWFREEGVNAISVSSVKMAEFFSRHGWTDITVAFPINVLEVEAINQILERGVDLKALIVNQEAVPILEEKVKGTLGLLIELDAGYNRTGVSTRNMDEIRGITNAINASNHLNLYGIYCHPGNTYHAESTEDIKRLWSHAIEEVTGVKQALSDANPALKVRMGDTPGCTVVENMEGIDEIGPGNFVFYDLVMNYLDVCEEEDIAVAMACPVVAKYPERGEIVIHGGAVHFSKDHLFDQHERKFFGEVVVIDENGWSPIVEGIKLASLSQEHGILRASDELLATIEVGDILGVLPIHSCLTANLMKSYLTFNGQRIDHLENLN